MHFFYQLHFFAKSIQKMRSFCRGNKQIGKQFRLLQVLYHFILLSKCGLFPARYTPSRTSLKKYNRIIICKKSLCSTGKGKLFCFCGNLTLIIPKFSSSFLSAESLCCKKVNSLYNALQMTAIQTKKKYQPQKH